MERDSPSLSPSDPTTPNTRAARILIVEDQRLIARDLQYRILQLGYLPTVVASGEAALCSIEAAPPDLVLMDIILQGPMDGVQVAERIRARFEIPIIYVTAHADRATLERAKRTRPSGYLIKPYEDDELRQAIGHALGDPRADG